VFLASLLTVPRLFCSVRARVLGMGWEGWSGSGSVAVAEFCSFFLHGICGGLGKAVP
jgi:hypothetical protein